MKRSIKLFSAVVAVAVAFTACKKPAASFTASDTEVKTGEVVTFTNGSTDNEKGLYIWDFGDGTSSTAATGTVTHAYQRPGTYTVNLRATKKKSMKNASDASPMTITVTGVSADFTAPTNVVAGQVVMFTNKTDSTSAERFVWDFGDGTSSEAMNPSHVYPSGGTYTVTLTAYGINQASVSSKSQTVTVSGAGIGSINTSKLVGSWKLTSNVFTNMVDGVTSTTSPYNCSYNPSVQMMPYSLTTPTTNKIEVLANGEILVYDTDGNVQSSSSYSFVDDTRINWSTPALRTTANSSYIPYTTVSNMLYTIVTLDATTFKITAKEVDSNVSLYNCSSVTQSSGHKQEVTWTATYTKM
jgi:PKD repeat protein